MSSDVDRAKRLVLAIGVAAAFGDLTYEGARSISGPYLALLGASATTIGFVVGLGELGGYGARVLFGWIADRSGAHWTMVAMGYGVNLVAVPCLALADRPGTAALLVVLERLGKALRSPSKGVLLSAAADDLGHGKVFGIEEALDQLGAFVGPLVVAAVFAALLVPVLATLAALAIARRSALPTAPTTSDTARTVLPRRFFQVLGAISLVACGFVDWALLAVHAESSSLLTPGTLPLAYAVLMAIDGAAALAFGTLFDRFGLRILALAAALAASAPLLAFQTTLGPFLVGCALWAVALGALESIAKAAVGKSAPREARGRAFGLFFGGFGLAWWLGSTAIGALLDASREAAMAFAAILPAIGAVWLFVLARQETVPAPR
jgi:MFS family permease